MCSFGMAPSALNVLPASKVQCSNMPPACITDNQPMVNIMPFGMCTCGSGNGGRNGSSDSAAVRTGNSSTLGTGLSDSIGGRKTSGK